MTFTLTLGWWVLPLIVTIGAYVAAYFATPKVDHSGMFGNVAIAAIAGVLYFAVATILSLLSWLIWALVT